MQQAITNNACTPRLGTPRQALGRVSGNVPGRLPLNGMQNGGSKAPADTMDWFESKRVARERQQAAQAAQAARERMAAKRPFAGGKEAMGMTAYLDHVEETLNRLGALCDAEQENANMLTRKYEHAVATPRGLQLRAARPQMA